MFHILPCEDPWVNGWAPLKTFSNTAFLLGLKFIPCLESRFQTSDVNYKCRPKHKCSVDIVVMGILYLPTHSGSGGPKQSAPSAIVSVCDGACYTNHLIFTSY